jgi:hypothetical protein
MQAQEAPSNYWLDLCFNEQLTFDDEFIDFEKMNRKGRRLAPFVAPLAQGKPLLREGSTVTRLKVAYSKMLDPVTPTRMMRRRPGELLAPIPQNPQQRRDAIIADIVAAHRDAVERRWEWLAARAVIDGAVTIVGDDYPARYVDFQRPSGNTVTLGSGARWGDNGVSILSNLNAWIFSMTTAPYGGPVTRLTLGPDACDVLLKDAEVKAQMDIMTRGTVVNVNTGVREGQQIEFMGKLSPTLEVYRYTDYYEDTDGSFQPFLDPKSAVLTGPNLQGIRAFGAIQDAHAQFQALPVFVRNYIEDNPGIEYVLSQSAPLMVPMNPVQSFKARVLA